MGVGFDGLKQRELQRSNRRLLGIAGASLIGMAFTVGLSMIALDARDKAQRHQEEADKLIGFMLGDLGADVIRTTADAEPASPAHRFRNARKRLADVRSGTPSHRQLLATADVLVTNLSPTPLELTSLTDDSVGASLDPTGFPHLDTNNNGVSIGVPGQWRGLVFDQYSNDRNVRTVIERESPNNAGVEVNGVVGDALLMGELAPNVQSADDNRTIGFDIHGFFSADDSRDKDVYSFQAPTGQEIWIALDRTAGSLDAIVELVLAD